MPNKICNLLFQPKQEITNYDVQSFLSNYMPDFYFLVEVQNISWVRINKIFANHLNRIKKEFTQTGKPVLKDATFYSIVMSKIKQDGRGGGMGEICRDMH